MSTKRILLVDDEAGLLQAMKIRLAVWGYDVITASSGKEAINIAKKNKDFFDAIILDIMMPGIDGLETLNRIRRFDKEVPVLILTAYPSGEKIKEAESLGISGFIPKGAQFEDASRIIRVALRLKKSGEEE
ncbi:MAG: response regulator [Candidatus Omnitrophota bacterium]